MSTNRPLSRQALTDEMNAIIERSRSRWKNDGTSSSMIAQARSEMAQNLKTDIQLGTYDEPVSTAQDFYIDTIRARWHQLTPRQKKRLYQIDSLLQISIRQLVGPKPLQTESEKAVEKSRRGPWFWPVVGFAAFMTIVLGGTALALIFPA